MKKILCLTLAVMLLLCGLTACGTKKKEAAEDDWTYIEGKGKLIVGVTEYEPMDWIDAATGEWTGFDADYARAVGEKLGVEVEFIVIDWDNKVNELNSKAIDCVWNGMTINDSLKQSMDITDAYVYNSQVVVMAADKLAKYPDVESMKTLNFAVESGSAGQDMAVENEFKYVAVGAQSDALMEVAAGSADACIIDITMANAMTGEGTSYAALGKGISLSEEEYGVGCRKGSNLVEKINEVTAAMRADGSLKAIADKYGLTLAE